MVDVGDLIADRFVLEHLAGRGGMGTVYAATDRSSGQRVALKVLHEQPESHEPPPAVRDPAEPASSRLAQRFLREARVLAELDHPGIARHIAHGVTGDGRLFLAMEWLDGEDLGKRLRGGRLPLPRAIDIVARVADTLGFVHARGIVHRDIKPSNIFLLHGDEIRVIDFGVARLGGYTAMTRTGATLGTIGYMAPEQASGALHVDPRADVFALGCVLFECLTGRNAFAGAQLVAVLAKVLFEHPPRASDLVDDVPPELDSLLAAMLAKDPADRPANGAELARAIRSLDSRETARLPALTQSEQRGASIVLAIPSSAANGEATSPTRPTLDDPRQLVGLPDVRVANLAGGALAIVIAGAGHGADHARRAASCALALAKARSDMMMAVVTGRAVMKGAVPVGEAIDRAALLVQRAREPAILVDDVTAGLLEMRFEIRDGVLRGERAFEDTRTLLGRTTPIVGRDRELQYLSGLIDECVGEPIARAVLVTAPAGIGKTRLCRELLGRLDARDPLIRVWLARGDSMREGSPFGVLARALESSFGIRVGDAPQLAREKMRARVVPLLGDAGPRTADLIGEIMGLPSADDHRIGVARQEPAVMGDRMRGAWLAWLEAECADGPIAIVIEDLHWGDLPSINYLDAALGHLRDKPLFVVATARPEIAQAFPSLWSRHELQELKLSSLTRGASARLVREVLGAIPDRDVDRIVDRAGGNALFLEELIRAHAEGKADTPETVRAIVRGRLEELSAGARQVLRAASIYGEVCWRDAVEALVGSAQRPDEVERNLEVLVDREMLHRRQGNRFADELGFRHAFVRDVAYDMLTDADRALGHRLAGEWLEARGERDAMTLAEHFERGLAPERAIRWFQRAAAQALEGNDLVAVLERAGRGIACGAEGEMLGALRLLEAQAHDWRGENAESADAGRAALAHLPQGSDAWFEAMCEVAVAYRRMVELRGLGELGEIVRALETREVVSPIALRTASRVVIQLAIGGAIELAVALHDALERRAARSCSDPAARAWAYSATGVLSMIAGRPWMLMNNERRMLEDIEASGDRRSGSNIRLYLGIAAGQTGAFERSEQLFRESLAIADSLGIHTMSLTVRAELAAVLVKLGRVSDGMDMLRDLPDAIRAQNDLMQVAHMRSFYAASLLQVGDAAGALDQAERSLAIVAPKSPFRAETIALASHALREMGRLAEAAEAAESAVALLDSHAGRVRWGTACVLRARAEVYRLVGNLEGAGRDVERAAAFIAEQARHFDDEGQRSTYVQRVSESAKLLALARQLGHEPGATMLDRLAQRECGVE